MLLVSTFCSVLLVAVEVMGAASLLPHPATKESIHKLQMLTNTNLFLVTLSKKDFMVCFDVLSEKFI